MSTPNNNSKSILAKALATENITVEFNPASHTAKFDIANRILTMPILKQDESECVTDMFIGHECGHALFSPYREKDTKAQGGWWIEAEDIGGTGNAQYVQDIMNIVEDVRIEKLMQSKFPGLRRDFTAAYRELADRDFFATVGKNLNDFNLIDRINLHFKCGAFMNVPFTADEQGIVDAIDTVQTHEEMVDATRRVFNYLRGQKFNAPKMQSGGAASMNDQQSDDESNGNGQGMTVTGDAQSDGNTKGDQSKTPNNAAANPDGAVEGNNHSQSQGNNTKGGTGLAPDNLLPPIKTQKAFDDKKQEMVNTTIESSTITTLPVPDLSKIIFPHKKAHEVISNYYSEYSRRGGDYANLINSIKTSYSDLVKSVNPLINTLIKQFEMKKAADMQKRTSISRTGKIDCDRIFKYKVTDDIFSRFSKIAEGKNHGLVMYVDWSSSMQMMTDDVLTQIIMLTQFCRRMNIPFDVYLFSSQYEMFNHYGQQKAGTPIVQYKDNGKTKYTNRNGNTSIDNSIAGTTPFALIHMLSSSMSKIQINDAMFNTYLLGKMITGYGKEFEKARAYRGYPNCFGQGNTPLDPTILAAMYMVPEFQQKHKVQIVNTIFLTDGDSGYNYFQSYMENDSYYSQRYKSTVRSPLTNKEFVANDPTSTDTMLRMFREVTGSTTIGFYISSGGHCRYTNGDSKDLRTALKDHGFVEADQMKVEQSYNYATRSYDKTNKIHKNHGYDRLFVLPSRVEIVDDLEELDNLSSNATLTKIRNTFMKSVEKRGNSRLFLNRFADVIANPATR